MPLIDEDVRLRRMEVMLRRLTGSLNPQMTVGEIQHLLGFKDRTAVQTWLHEHKLKPVGKWRYRRLDVIAAREEDTTQPHPDNDETFKVRIELNPAQVESLCWFIADEVTAEMLEPVQGDDFLAVVQAWRTGRDTWVERYLERYIDNRDKVEALAQSLDASVELLEQLACKLTV